MSRQICALVCAACVSGLLAVAPVQAQTILVPAANQVFPAGPDYASDVLQDPWDFSNDDDLSPSPDEFGGWATTPARRWYTDGTGPTFLTRERFVATASGDNQLMLLSRGDAISLNPGRTGLRYPIDTTRYRKFAMKVRYNGAPPGPPFFQPVVYWLHSPYTAPNFLNRGGGAIFSIIPAGDTTAIYTIDLAAVTTPETGLVAACGVGGGCTGVPARWTAEGNVVGFRIDPTTQSTPLDIEIYWVRLTSSDNSADAASMNVSLASGTCTGSSTISVVDLDNVETTVVSGGSTSGASFNYGIFPPGTYRLRVACANGTSETPFVINDPPRVTVIDPDETGDPATDFEFTDSSGANRWDFEEASATDIARTGNVSTTAGACSGGGCGIIPSDAPGAALGSKMYRASSVGSTPSELGDPIVEFLAGLRAPLSSLRHRYLTFALRINRPYDLTVGSVARLLWGSQPFSDQSSGTTTQDMRVWPGFRRYTIDLGALTVENGGIETECLALSPPCLTTPWPLRSIRFFRIDPHEFGDAPTSFDLDDVSLTAPDSVNLAGAGSAGSFTIRWNVDDTATSSTYTTRIFIDNDTDASSGLGEISGGALATSLGANQFVWTPPPTLAPGTYWVYAQTTETRGLISNVQGAYSTGPLVVYSSSSTSPVITVTSPAPNQVAPLPFTVTGCAFDQGNTSGLNMDEVALVVIAGNGVAGVPAGTTFTLGFGTGGLGTLQYGPLTPGTPVECPSVSAGSPFRNSGFRVSDVSLPVGPWTLRVYGRSTISGLLTRAADVPFTLSGQTQAPTNLQITGGAGATVNLSWTAPTGGPPIGGYQVDFALNNTFTQAFGQQVVAGAATTAAAVTVPAVQANSAGPWFFRVRTLAPSGAPGEGTSNIVSTTVPVGASPPGPPVLTATQVTTSPITLSWAAGPGGLPAGYTLIAGTSQGGSDLGTFPMGPNTSVTAAAPAGLRIYARVIATNAQGLATSNEINFQIGGGTTAPSAPVLTATQVGANPITLSWAPGPFGGAPTSYTLHAGTDAGASDLGVFPMGAATSISAQAPAGMAIFVRVIAANGAGSATSNEVNFALGAPTAPGAPTLNAPGVSGPTVSFTWTPGSGTASSYTLLARLSPTGPVIASLPGLSGSSFSVVAPSGTYFVTLAAVSGALTSPESNQVTVVVP